MFLFDEPRSNFDAELRVHMRLELARLHQRLGATMIYVTHDQVEAMTLADNIVVLRAGQVEQVGPPLTVFDDPANLFVAGFIGSPKMNFLPAQVTDPEDRTLVVGGVDGARDPMPWLQTPLTKRQEVTLGIRPQHLRLASVGRLRIRPDVVEQLLDVGYLHGITLDGAEVVVQVTGRLPVAPETEVSLTFDPARAFVFDKAGQRLR